jgi:CheY-like chemotaxis protein
VRVRASREGNDLVVAVADTGTGIATEDMGKLFRPFSQVDGSIHRRHAGTGLGLSISKYFVELHGGGIWVQSEKGVGTTFFFRLPLSPPMPLEGGSLHKLIPGWEYLQRTRPSMAPEVVVRSRYVVLETGNALQRLLARYWHEVETVPVTSLDEASAELSRTPAQAVLINDLSVSKTLERLSSRERLPHDTPTIVCSIPGVHDSAGNLGASAYLVKPVSREVLLEVLGRLRLDGGTVLIVDDEPDALHLFGRMLASSGYDYRVLLARDGQEALHILQDRRPDVLLLDLVMPNMDGFRLLETMHRNPTFRDIPVVVISARDPAGQPIVSQALAVTRSTGLSVRQIMTSIEALSRALSPAARVGDPAPTGALSASPVFE